MIREILTLKVDNTSTSYYIQFEKDRKQFFFQPTLFNKTAPSFTVFVTGDEMKFREEVSADIRAQACEKIKEILSNIIFDKF
ncbi:MAG TPA: hypothetical protein VM012_12190 [Flavitalea sp.]|nr:hypothetical protein [Flavitalea sp.]